MTRGGVDETRRPSAKTQRGVSQGRPQTHARPLPCSPASLFSSASQHSPDVLSSPTLQVRELSHEGTPRSPSRHS